MAPRPLLLGHRGARAVHNIRENTLASFDLALAHGCDGFEFDVRLTADGEAVVCHDPCANGIEISRARMGELIALPRLEQVLARYQSTAFLDIELKVAGLERVTSDFLKQRRPVRGFLVTSFLPEVLQTLHAADPGIPLGLICETHAQLNCWAALSIEYLVLHRSLADRSLIEQLHGADKGVFVWTINERSAARRFAEMGVEGIISDETKLLAKAVAAPDKES